jgi:hypothetical protein
MSAPLKTVRLLRQRRFLRKERNMTIAHKSDDALLTIAEVAAIVRAPVATLRYWRHLGNGPHSFKVGRGVRYWRSDVMTWLEEQSD